MLGNKYSILTNKSDIIVDVNRKKETTYEKTHSLKMFSANGAGIVGGKKKSLVSLIKKNLL